MDLTIRQARHEDQRAIVDCIQAAYTRYIERIGKKPAPMLANNACQAKESLFQWRQRNVFL
jgi:hypothetical protein